MKPGYPRANITQPEDDRFSTTTRVPDMSLAPGLAGDGRKGADMIMMVNLIQLCCTTPTGGRMY